MQKGRSVILHYSEYINNTLISVLEFMEIMGSSFSVILLILQNRDISEMVFVSDANSSNALKNCYLKLLSYLLH